MHTGDGPTGERVSSVQSRTFTDVAIPIGHLCTSAYRDRSLS